MLLPGVLGAPAGAIASVEGYFSDNSARAKDVERNVRTLLKALTRAQKALATGDVTSVARAIDDVNSTTKLVGQTVSLLAEFRSTFIEEAFQDERYFKEITAIATREGISGVRSTEGRLFSYPYVIERKKAGLALAIGATHTRNIRPSAVVATLAGVRKGRSRFEHRALLDAVEGIYEITRRGQATELVDIEDVYLTLTALPGSDKEYPLLEFLATLDEIKRAGLVTSRTGRLLDLPPPSTTGKGGRAFRVIREDGREQLYRMLSFAPPAPQSPQL